MCSLSQLCLVFQDPWPCAKPVPAAWTPQSIPFHEDFTNLASLLSRRVSSYARWFFSFVADANTLASHPLIVSCMTFNCSQNIRERSTIDQKITISENVNGLLHMDKHKQCKPNF
jgi:hypothetical protein